jgi:hypothetical protein
MAEPSSGQPIQGPPSLTAAQIDAVLATYGSPATGMGQTFYDGGVAAGIDPAWALAFFIHESTAGTHPGWAGRMPGGRTTHNIGNIVCARYDPDGDGQVNCHGRFRAYDSWATGIADWYRLIAQEYIARRGVTTVEQIAPIYAPAFENNVPGYIAAVTRLIDGWRAQPPPNGGS